MKTYEKATYENEKWMAQGAVAVAVKIGGSCRLLFVACHLAAHTQALGQRNCDYARIRAGLFSSRTPGAAPPPSFYSSSVCLLAVELT
jgi:hypothetical protein